MILIILILHFNIGCFTSVALLLSQFIDIANGTHLAFTTDGHTDVSRRDRVKNGLNSSKLCLSYEITFLRLAVARTKIDERYCSSKPIQFERA